MRFAAVALPWLFVMPVAAADFGSVDGLDIRVDTFVRASVGVRTSGADALLLGTVNADDGDRAFGPGLISERVDITTTLDATRGDFGLEIGADGWYDAAYHGTDANRSPATFNPVTVAHDAFPADVSRLMGGSIELNTAYVHDKFDPDGVPVTVRVGRQNLLWGESLFFAQDGIAGAQAPVDVIKQASQPLAEAREVYLPVTQADLRVALPGGLSVEAYDQFEWRRDRLPGVASYFSTSDILDVGGQRVLIAGGPSLVRASDDVPSGIGQFGIALRRDSGALGLGIYALRYDAKAPQVELGDRPGTYRLAFPQGIELLGASASTYISDDAISGEISVRRHLPLVGRLPSLGEVQEASKPQIGGPLGRTVQALASLDRVVAPGRFWDGARMQVEFTGTELLAVEEGSGLRLPRTTRFALGMQTVFIPEYYHLRHDLTLTVPVGVRIGLVGRSSVDAGQDAGTGNVTIGIAATYRSTWRLGLFYTNYIGSPEVQKLADRDFVTFSVARTF